MTMTAKSNIENRNLLEKMLGDNNPFNQKGLHYLACRMGGVKYKKALTHSLNLLIQGTMKEIVPPHIQSKVAKAFSYKETPDPAMVIIGTGRRAILGKEGWDEAGYSLLNVPQPPLNLAEMDAEAQKVWNTRTQIRTQQKEACELLMQFFESSENQLEIQLEEFDSEPEPVVKEKPKAVVLEFKKPETVEDIPEIAEENPSELIDVNAIPATEPQAIAATAEDTKPVKPKKSSKKSKTQPQETL